VSVDPCFLAWVNVLEKIEEDKKKKEKGLISENLQEAKSK
jgi:hypothetical protein